MRCLVGIDYGEKRIGVAIGDMETRIATPKAVVEGRNDPTRDARRLADWGREAEAAAFVVGLPLNMDGSEGPQAALTRRFASELGRLSGLPVYLRDERLTSFAAGDALESAGVPSRKRKNLMDAVSAQKILQAYFDQGLANEAQRD